MAAKKNEKLFMQACKKKFKEEPTDMETKYYCYGGWRQSKRRLAHHRPCWVHSLDRTCR